MLLRCSVDSEGYPDETELEKIRNWSLDDFSD